MTQGSLIVFSESLLHATADWTHKTRSRVAIAVGETVILLHPPSTFSRFF